MFALHFCHLATVLVIPQRPSLAACDNNEQSEGPPQQHLTCGVSGECQLCRVWLSQDGSNLCWHSLIPVTQGLGLFSQKDEQDERKSATWLVLKMPITDTGVSLPSGQ